MELEQMMALIKQRRSIRRFSKGKIERWQLELLVEAAIWAPSGSNAQAWQFVVVDDAATLQRLTAFLPGVLQAPPAMICLCVDYQRELAQAGKLGVKILGIMDISMAAQNIMLAAETLHLGSCAIRGFNEDVIKMALVLPEQVKPELLVIVGKPLQPAKAPTRRPLGEVLRWQSTSTRAKRTMDKKTQFYDLLAYIAAAAKEMHNDPQIYASLRLLSVMQRLLEMAADEEGLDQIFLQETQQMILEKRSLLLNDREQFGVFLDQLTRKIATKSFS